MALLDWEGFDRETANLNIFSASNIAFSADGQGVFGYGRYGSTTNGGCQRTPAWSPSIPVGYLQAHLWIGSIATNQGYHLAAYLGSSEQCQVRLGTSGRVELWRGNTLVASGSAYPVNTWFFLQIRFDIRPSGGSVTVKINGATVLSYTGNTANTGVANWDGWKFGGVSGPTGRVDNLIAYSEDGLAPNTWTPETRIWDTLPSGAGGSTEWTPSAGSNWQCVDEQPSNGDTDYVSASAAPATDTYSCAAAAEAGSVIYGVAVHATLRKDDAGTNEVDGILRSGGTNYARSAPASINSSYSRSRWLWETDPATGSAWTVTAANAAQPGVRRTT